MCLCLALAFCVWAETLSRVAIDFSVHAPGPTRLQVFYDSTGRFAESRSAWLEAPHGGAENASLSLRGNAAQLRFDPPSTGPISICGLRVAGLPAEFAVERASEVGVGRQDNCLSLTPVAGAVDPQLVLRFSGSSLQRITRAGNWQRLLAGAIALTTIALLWLGLRIRPWIGQRSLGLPVMPWAEAIERQAHWICAGLMLAFGSAYLLVTPPGAVADEQAHLDRIFTVARGLSPWQGAAPLIADSAQSYGIFSNYPNNKSVFSYGQLQSQVDQPLNCSPSVGDARDGAAGYFPHHYLLPALAYRAACQAGASFGSFLYLSRLLNLLVATVLVTWGVAIAGRGRMALIFVALLPMALFQMASISADALGLGASIAWLGAVSAVASGRRKADTMAPAFLGLALVIAFLKPGTAWILATWLLCWPAYRGVPGRFWTGVACYVLLPLLLHLAWTAYATGSPPVREGVDASANFQALASEPWMLLRVLAASIQDSAAHWGRMLVGVLGWLDVPLAAWAYAAAAVGAVASLAGNREPYPRIQPGWIVYLFALTVGSLLLVALPLFVYWTPAGSPVLQGVQGRYLLVTAAMVMAWSSIHVPQQLRQWCIACAITVAVVLNLHAVQRLVESYFVVGRFA